MCATDRLLARFREAEESDLSLAHQIRHDADDILDRHGGIHAVLVEKIDAVSSETAERAFDGFANMLRPAVHSCDGAVLELEPELGRDDDAVALAVERAGEQCLVGVGPVRLGRVKECHSEFDGSVDGCDGLPIVALFGGAVCKAHPHAAKSDG